MGTQDLAGALVSALLIRSALKSLALDFDEAVMDLALGEEVRRVDAGVPLAVITRAGGERFFDFLLGSKKAPFLQVDLEALPLKALHRRIDGEKVGDDSLCRGFDKVVAPCLARVGGVSSFAVGRRKRANAGLARVYPYGAISVGQKGETLAEIAEMVGAGAVAGRQ